MAETLVSKKAQRLNFIYNLLMSNPRGLTTQELARQCGVTQRTIQRDLMDLQDEPLRMPLVEDNHRWKVLPHSRYILPPVRFELTEAAALFLAARLLSRYASDNIHEYLLSPYFIEPSGVGYAIYVIGYATFFEDVHTFKLERIQHAELTNESFEIPADFDALALLSTAWGVMYGDRTETVGLRFSPVVARRVQETVWHPTPEIVEEPDGGCRLTVHVAHPLEMQPWIRGWGPDCEVLAPAWLRQAVAEDMRRAAAVYGNSLG